MSLNQAWIILVIAGLLEVVWAVGLKYSHGYTRFWPTLITILGMIASVWLLGIAIKKLPLGTAYAVWTGIGALGTVLLGVVLFGESMAIARLMCIMLIVAGIIGLKWLT
ncbi:quaternary ammonium compound efflux SMR transporter SugE [soil metagenome]